MQIDLRYGTYFIDYKTDEYSSVGIIVFGENNKSNIENIKTITTYKKYKIYETGKIDNAIINKIEEDYVVLVDSNCRILTNNWIEKLLGFCQRKDVGAVSGKFYKNNKIYNAGYILSHKKGVIEIFKGIDKEENIYFSRENIIQNLNAVSGRCIMFRKEFLKELSFEYNKDFWDIDLCLKLRKENYKIVFNPYVEIEYMGSEDFNEDDRKIFLNKWSKRLEICDEYYNKNLSLDTNCYELKG